MASTGASRVVIIRQKGEKHFYTVPSFPVVTAMLREVSNRFWEIMAPRKWGLGADDYIFGIY